MISIRNFEKRFERMFLKMLMNYAHRIRNALVWITKRISDDEVESIKMLYTEITGREMFHSQESVNCVEIHFGRYFIFGISKSMEFYVQIKNETWKQYEKPTTSCMMNFSTEILGNKYIHNMFSLDMKPILQQ